MEKKFQIEMAGWLGLDWSHSFKSTSINLAQDYARQVCLKCPVGVVITLWMEDKEGWENWGTWERRVARRVDEFAKKEATVEEKLKLAVETAIAPGDEDEETITG